MKKIWSILIHYLRERIPWKLTLLSFVLAAVAVFLEYRFGLRRQWLSYREFSLDSVLTNMAFYGAAPLLFLWMAGPVKSPGLSLLLLTSLFAFALRSEFTAHHQWLPGLENYEYRIRLTNVLFLGPLLSILPLIWYLTVDRKSEKLYGCSIKQFEFRPYLLLLLCMVPLVAVAATQPDFLDYYPKVKHLFNGEFLQHPKEALIYELFYGLDFVYVEFFFRGFLVIAFSRYIGVAAIPFAALLYCTIHFGKPLGETISSWFGGMILGILVMETRSILGGVMVHMGIAWMMEAGGWLGNLFLRD